jgi:hypothetical protein
MPAANFSVGGEVLARSPVGSVADLSGYFFIPALTLQYRYGVKNSRNLHRYTVPVLSAFLFIQGGAGIFGLSGNATCISCKLADF